ncbi:hypothetical protein ACIBAH_35020 [Streptomyces sp. NPDC051445]|uniref:hypothetical protein n=1 Tax=Streptomyces sp. NPDC051445 TaxID=3365653 RepID=UPI00379C659F
MKTCAMPAKGYAKPHTGGFTATREFGFDLAEKFPELDLSDVDTDGAAVVVHVQNPRALHLHKLARFLTSAAKGGVRTAVLHVPSRGLMTALPIFNLFLAVDASAELKDMMRLERAMRTGG